MELVIIISVVFSGLAALRLIAGIAGIWDADTEAYRVKLERAVKGNSPTGPEAQCSDILYFEPGDKGSYKSPRFVDPVSGRYTGVVSESGQYYALIDFKTSTNRYQERVSLTKLLEVFFNQSLADRRSAGQDHDRYTVQMEAVLAKTAVEPNALVRALMDDTDMDEDQATQAARSAVSRLSS